MHDDQVWQNTLHDFCRSAAKLILKGVGFAELRSRLTPSIDGLLDHIGIPAEIRAPDLLQAMSNAICIEVWNATPIPENRFRPRKFAKPERNAPCSCGSGRKYKQCCAQLPDLALGVTEEVMLAEVLHLLPAKMLAAVPLLELHSDALAMVAHRWLEDGEPKKAVSLLERYFTHLEKLDGRAELAADTLLNAYLDTRAPRKKQQFVDALKNAPDKDLRSCGWQRQATIFSDRGDYAGAWVAFREAQRHAPNAPALSHLEILLLLSEGRDTEAKARADFWIARLQRDAKFDHSELIETLRNMVGGDSGIMKTMHLARGPLGLLANVIADWPEPACAYRLVGDCELEAKAELARLEERWMDLREDGNLEGLFALAAKYPLTGQSFLILRDLSEFVLIIDGSMPGSNEALSRQILQRGETLRKTVLTQLKALKKELPWGFLNNRPMLSLVGSFVLEFMDARHDECLDLMRWSVTVANPTDNTGLREYLIHGLIAAGRAQEAIEIAAAYPNDYPGTEYGRVLAYFANGQIEAAEYSLRLAVERWPKAWKMLHAATPKRPRSKNPGYVTVGGDDQAWEYRNAHLELWRSTGALKWFAGIKIAPSTKKKPAAPTPVQDDLFS